jgi:hypothetical protein
MNRVYLFVMACVCWALFVATAPCCMASEDETEKLNAVRNAVADLFDSTYQGDEKKFKACTFVREGEEELSKVVFGFMRSVIGTRKAIVDRFGEKGLEAAKDGPGRGISFRVPPEGREWVKELEFEFPDANTAVAFNKYTNRDVVVVRHKDRWLVDLGGQFERPIDIKELSKTLRHWSNAYEKGAAECKQEGSTIPKVVDAVFAELAK